MRLFFFFNLDIFFSFKLAAFIFSHESLEDAFASSLSLASLSAQRLLAGESAARLRKHVILPTYSINQ